MAPVVPPHKLVDIGYRRSQLDTSGIKLTVDSVYRCAGSGVVKRGFRLVPEYIKIRPIEDKVYRLESGYYIIKYREYIRVPKDMIALALPRSSLLRMGATIYTAVWDPGYEGRGRGLLAVWNESGIELERGAHVAQLVFFRMEEPPPNPYKGAYYGEE